MLDYKDVRARGLFDGIARSYQGPAEFFSFGQYGRWRRALVHALDIPSSARALDIATGTGLIARDIARTYGCDVTGLDQSSVMLEQARANRITVTGGDAQRLPFDDATFDALTFSYLFRYVDDVEATFEEIARVAKPGAVIGSVEFGLPSNPAARALWHMHARGVMRALCKPLGQGWRTVGDFLGDSIAQWGGEWPVKRQLEMWRARGVDAKAKQMSFGAGVVIVGRKR